MPTIPATSNPPPPRGSLHKVWFLLFENFQLLDVSGPLQVFASANDELRLLGVPPIYDTRVLALQEGLIRSSSGVELKATGLPRRLTAAVQTMVVPGGPGVWQPGLAPETSPIAPLPGDELAEWTRRAAPKISRIVSVCTGAFVLARAGLLDGGGAVTHWAACEQLATRYPKIDVQRNAIYFRQGRCWTSAGVTAGIDMALGMVEADVGRQIAMAVAKKLVVFYKRPGGQSQFSSALLAQTADDGRIGELHQWIGLHLRTPLSVGCMAEKLSMAPRTFARFYLRQTGITPAHAVTRIRLERACRLLETSDRSLKTLAQQCGFHSEEVMRRAFLRQMHVSPLQYRERFSAS